MSASTTPLISIVIPTYRRPEMVLLAVKCALDQSYRNIEVVVCDDGSPPEDTRALLDIADDRLRIEAAQQNQGQWSNWARGITTSKGDFVVLLCDDDLLSPTFVEEMVSVINRKPSVNVVFCPTKEINLDGSIERTFDCDLGTDETLVAADIVKWLFGSQILAPDDFVWVDFGV